MTQLTTTSSFQKPDDVYQMIIDAHSGLSDDESMRFNAKLILLLANHIGDTRVLAQAIAAARQARRD
ncbi:MAG: DUF2783 domain-containing protein [Pseudomonadota bacterium]